MATNLVHYSEQDQMVQGLWVWRDAPCRVGEYRICGPNIADGGGIVGNGHDDVAHESDRAKT